MPIQPIYLDLHDVTDLQKDIMRFIEWWVHNKKTPIPLKAIVADMKDHGVKEHVTVFALKQLMRKKYIRQAIMISNTRSYVQLRRV